MPAVAALGARAIMGRLFGAVAGGAGRRALTGAVAGTAVAGVLGLGGGDGDGGGGGGGDGTRQRRRRRRALTQSDRNDIAFIAATISAAVAGKFAIQLATRSR